jgi:hypothetical protein
MGEAWADRVILDLLPGEPISGRISTGNQQPESFRGWVDLASKLEHLRSDLKAGGADPLGESEKSVSPTAVNPGGLQSRSTPI